MMFGLAAVLVLVLLNGFFVATEFAIVAVRRSRLAQLADQGNTAARVASDVVGHLDAYIAACQLGITMASLALGWVGEPALAHLIQPPMEALAGRFAPQAAHAAAVAFTLITGLHNVVGELAPKGLALQRTDATTLCVARPIRAFYLVFRWPITALNAVGNAACGWSGCRPRAAMSRSTRPRSCATWSPAPSRPAGWSPPRHASPAERWRSPERTLASLMTHRGKVDAIPLGADRKQLLARVAAIRHSRLLVYRDSLDDLAGVLHVHDLFAVLQRPPGSFDLQGLLRPVLTVPESLAADDLLERMQAEGRQLAVVIDEYGSTAGIVTIEDLVEALVGPIQDEPALGGADTSAAGSGRGRRVAAAGGADRPGRVPGTHRPAGRPGRPSSGQDPRGAGHGPPRPRPCRRGPDQPPWAHPTGGGPGRPARGHRAAAAPSHRPPLTTRAPRWPGGSHCSRGRRAASTRQQMPPQATGRPLGSEPLIGHAVAA
jgi:putative hemolysin